MGVRGAGSSSRDATTCVWDPEGVSGSGFQLSSRLELPTEAYLTRPKDLGSQYPYGRPGCFSDPWLWPGPFTGSALAGREWSSKWEQPLYFSDIGEPKKERQKEQGCVHVVSFWKKLSQQPNLPNALRIMNLQMLKSWSLCYMNVSLFFNFKSDRRYSLEKKGKFI